MKHDVLVVGGGHNGLTAAAYLARAGKKVLVLERRPLLGGATVTEELYPGFRFLTGSYLISLLRPQVIRELKLAAHGLQLIPLESTVAPLPSGDYFAEYPDHDLSRAEMARHSRRDADAYDEFSVLMRRLAVAVSPLLDLIPPDPTSLSPRDLEGMARVRGVFDQMERRDFHALCRLVTMSIGDFLDEWFETPALKAIKATSGIIGSFKGVRTPGSGYVALHHYLGEVDGRPRGWAFPRGGTGALATALASSLRSHGGEVLCDAPVARVLVREGRACGVVLEDGREFLADRVVSNCDARRTYLGLLEPGHLDDEFVADLKRFQIQGPSSKVNLALDGLPQFTALGPRQAALLRGSIEIAPSLDYLEKAYDEAKYGGGSTRPFMDGLIPSLLDPSMAPPGQHVMSLFVQYAGEGVSSADFLERVIDTLAEHAPDIRSRILFSHISTPRDLEQRFGLTGGHIFHGELSLHQMMFLRPVPGWAQYRTPVRDLWMCGSSCHPGGCITGAPGRNAALEMLSSWT